MRTSSGRSSSVFLRSIPRERPYSVRRTWWGFLWQMLQLNASCRDVVAQFQVLFVLTGQRPVDGANSAYCQARGRLPEPLFVAALRASAAAVDQRVTPDGALQGRVVKVIDGTTLNLPDTAKNRAAFPQPKPQKPGVGFPQLHLLVVWSARGGGVLEHVRGSKRDGEMRLLNACSPPSPPATSRSTTARPATTSPAPGCGRTKST